MNTNIMKTVLDFYRQSAKSKKYANLHKVLKHVHWLSELEDAWQKDDKELVLHLHDRHHGEIRAAITWALDGLAKASPV